MGKLTISMAIFNSYVKLPEGTSHPSSRTNHCWDEVISSFLAVRGVRRDRKMMVEIKQVEGKLRVGDPQ